MARIAGTVNSVEEIQHELGKFFARSDETIKKIDVRSYQGGYKYIFTSTDTKDVTPPVADGATV